MIRLMTAEAADMARHEAELRRLAARR